MRTPFGQKPAQLVGSGEDVLTEQLLQSVSIFRWAALTWAILGVVLSRDELTQPFAAAALLALAAAFTLYVSVLAATKPRALASRVLLVSELALGSMLLLGDGFVFESTRSQSLPWAWPAAGIIAVGVCLGTRPGLLSATIVGGFSLFTELVELDRSQFVSAFSKIGLWLLVGAIAGALTQRLRAAEQQISLARTREEVARELHDGVLQTLAVVQRRSEDPELSKLAKEQENSLRRYLADSRIGELNAPDAVVGLESALRSVAAKGEQLYGLPTQVIVSPDCPDHPALPQLIIHAVAGATREAITNASKHGQATKVTIFAEPTDAGLDANHRPHGLFVSVKDDGVGFDVAAAEEGIGLSRSIRGRLEEQGGIVELTSRAGRGTEVQLWV